MTNKDFKHNEADIQRDLWALFKKHYNMDTDADCEACIREFNEVVERYDEAPFCMDMTRAMADQLMRRWNETHGKGYGV